MKFQILLLACLALVSNFAAAGGGGGADDNPSAGEQMNQFYNGGHAPSWVDASWKVWNYCHVSSDSFTTASYGNDRGDVGFSTEWQVYAPSHKGTFTIEDGQAKFTGGCCVGSAEGHWAQRGVNTQGYSYLQMWVKDQRWLMGEGHWSLDIYSNGVWHNNVREYTRPISGYTGWYDEKFMLPSSYASADMKFRFRNSKPISEGDKWYVDHVRLYFCRADSQLNHFRISHSGSALTCEGGLVNISAYDQNNQPYTQLNGASVTLEARNSDGTPAAGYWVKVSGSGTLSDPNNSDGLASYAYGHGEANASFRFHQSGAGVVNFNIASGGASENPAYDANMSFSNVGIRVLGEQPQIVGKSSALAPNAANLRLQIVNSNTLNGSCETRVPAGTSVNFAIKASCLDSANNAQACGAGNLLSMQSGANSAQLSASNNNLALSFADNGGEISAPFSINHSQAGNFSLDFNASLPATADYPAVNISGSSNPYNARPFALQFQQISSASGVNPAASANASNTDGDADGRPDADFVPAGQAFTAAIEAKAWQASDDTNNDGVADSGANLGDNAVLDPAQIEGMQALTFSVVESTPATGSVGTLAVDAVNLVGNQARAEVRYHEAGSVKLEAQLNNFMGSGQNITGRSGDIGRFYPAGFAMANSHLSYVGRMVSGQSCDFAYMGQPQVLALGLENLRAVDISGTTLTKYDDSIVGGYNTQAPVLQAENADDGVDLSARISPLSGSWQAGVYKNSNLNPPYDFYQQLSFARGALPDGPLTALRFSLQLPNLQGLDADTSSSGSCGASCDSKLLDGGKSLAFYYGVLATPAVNGYQADTLPLAVQMHYYQAGDGLTYLQQEENCLDYNAPGFWLSAPQLSGSLAAQTSVQQPVGNQLFSEGQSVQAPFRLDPANQQGELMVEFFPTADWLKFDWNNNGTETGPSARAIFTAERRGHDKVIYWQERQ